MTSAVKPEPEPKGSIVQPVTPEEAFVTAQHLEGEAQARDWGRQGWALFAAGKAWCERQGS